MSLKQNITTRWNPLDTFFYNMDKAVEGIRASSSQEEIAVEEMIEAETRYLKQENELLKELQYPKAVLVPMPEAEGLRCPNKRCREDLAEELFTRYRIKFCPNCGQRIYRARMPTQMAKVSGR